MQWVLNKDIVNIIYFYLWNDDMVRVLKQLYTKMSYIRNLTNRGNIDNYRFQSYYCTNYVGRNWILYERINI